MLRIKTENTEFIMVPGEWRSSEEQDLSVGRHIPPSSERVAEFMAFFEKRFTFEPMGQAARILAMATGHHRFNYIHPFPDGNGRVSRLMSHAMAARAGIGAHGLWSISRGLARGLESRADYKRMMGLADTPRQGDLDGRGNLSLKALTEFTGWFLRVCLDQIDFMSELFDLDNLTGRLKRLVERSDAQKPEAILLLEEALIRGEFERGAAPRITGLPERTARRVLSDVVDAGLLASETPKGSVSLRFPTGTLETLFPRLYPET
jgi:Fic family protein